MNVSRSFNIKLNGTLEFYDKDGIRILKLDDHKSDHKNVFWRYDKVGCFVSDSKGLHNIEYVVIQIERLVQGITKFSLLIYCADDIYRIREFDLYNDNDEFKKSYMFDNMSMFKEHELNLHHKKQFRLHEKKEVDLTPSAPSAPSEIVCQVKEKFVLKSMIAAEVGELLQTTKNVPLTTDQMSRAKQLIELKAFLKKSKK